MRWFVAILTINLLCSCTYDISRKYLPNPASNFSFNDPVKTVVIPLPAIGANPNDGVTAGALAAFMLHNANDEVSTLIAPQVNYNVHYGITTTLYGAFYPYPERSLKINVSKSTMVNEQYRIRYLDEKFMSDSLVLNLTAFDYTDGSGRFFGFQPNSSQQNETNFSDQEAGLGGSIGYRFGGQYQLVLGDRYKTVHIRTGAVTGLPFISDLFSPGTVPGIDGYQVHDQEVSLIYSTLDSAGITTSGLYARFSVENSAKALGSSAGYQGYGGELKFFYPLSDARYISVVRFACKQMVGGQIPFLEQGSLGGETTLRGHGLNRFFDKSYVLSNVEERIRFGSWKIFNIKADWEVAPFIDYGSVMNNLTEVTSTNFEFNPGLGIRAVVRPNIVGRLDVGVGKNGPALFLGLGYPF
jgi:outer membrane protein assembly factor BamA